MTTASTHGSTAFLCLAHRTTLSSCCGAQHWAEAFDALGRTGRLDKRAVIQLCPSATTGMCGYSKTTINEVVAAGYRAIYNDW